MFLCTGDRVKVKMSVYSSSFELYIVATPMKGKVTLINLEGGNRLIEPVDREINSRNESGISWDTLHKIVPDVILIRVTTCNLSL